MQSCLLRQQSNTYICVCACMLVFGGGILGRCPFYMLHVYTVILRLSLFVCQQYPVEISSTNWNKFMCTDIV